MKSRGPIGTKYIAEQIGITPAAVSQHLKILKQAGLVTSERDGYRIPYSINEEAMGHCQQIVMEVCECGCHGRTRHQKREGDNLTLESLKKYKEEMLKEYRDQLKNEIEGLEETIQELESK